MQMSPSKDLGYEYDSEEETVEEALEDYIFELPGIPDLSSLNLTSAETIQPPKLVQIIPDPKFLADLINMGFNEKESKQALIDVKNESIELAVDKVFENKSKFEEQNNSDLQDTIEESLNDLSKPTPEQEQEELEKQRKLEEESKISEFIEFKAQKDLEIIEIQAKIDKITTQASSLKESLIIDFWMVASSDASPSCPLILGCVCKISSKYFLNLQSLVFHPKYLQKISNMNSPSYRLSVNTLIPLFMKRKTNEIMTCAIDNNEDESQNTLGEQKSQEPLKIKSDDKSLNQNNSRNNTQLGIFEQGMSHMVEIKDVSELFGCIVIKDSYTKGTNAIVCVHAKDDKGHILIPIHINSNFERVSMENIVRIESVNETEVKWQMGYLLIKTGVNLKVYKVNYFDFSESFNQLIKEIELPSNAANISLIDVSDYSSKHTLLSASLDPQKSNGFDRSNKNLSIWKVIIEYEGKMLFEDLYNASNKQPYFENSKENESKYQQNLNEDNKESLIDRKQLKNEEEFEVYESMIQGESHYLPAWLSKIISQDDPVQTFEYQFDKPISIFSLDVELYFEYTSNIKLPNDHNKDSENNHQQNQEPTVVNHLEIQNAKIDDSIEFEEMKSALIDNIDIKTTKKWLPLLVYTHEGCAFNATSQVSKLVTDDKRAFGANYSGSSFIFTHQFGKKFIIEKFIVMSDNSSQIGAYPMGSGILFLSDSLSALESTTPFHLFSKRDFVEWKKRRVQDPRPLEPYEPVAYFEMGTAIKIVHSLQQENFSNNNIDMGSELSLRSKATCKYIKLVPTSFKQTSNNLYPSQKFTTYPVEFKFFGIIGEEVDDTAGTSASPTTASNFTPYSLSICTPFSSHDIPSPLPLSSHIRHTHITSSTTIDASFVGTITSSSLQSHPAEKLTLNVCREEGERKWRWIGAKIVPKALIESRRDETEYGREERKRAQSKDGEHSMKNTPTASTSKKSLEGSGGKGVFSNIPVKILRSWFLEHEYFERVNKEITLALTDEDVGIQIRLRAINTLSLIISYNSKMTTLIFEHLELEKFLKMLYQQDSRGCRHIMALFRKFYEVKALSKQISSVIMENLSNLHKINMTSASLESFMSLVSCQMLSNSQDTFKIMFETFYNGITKIAIAKLHTEEYTILRKFVDSRNYPFDTTSFDSYGIESKDNKQTNLSINNFNCGYTNKQYAAKFTYDNRRKEYDIYLTQKWQINEIRLLFGQSLSKPYRMIITIYGYFDNEETLLYHNSYSESLYCYLTQNSFLNEYGFYDPKEERNALSINKFNYFGNRLKIEITFHDTFLTLNSESPIVENVIPEIYGEEKLSELDRDVESLILGKDVIDKSQSIDISPLSDFKICTVRDKKYKLIKWLPEQRSSSAQTPTDSQDLKQLKKNLNVIKELQAYLKPKIHSLNNASKQERSKMIKEITEIVESIESRKSPYTLSDDELNSDEIVESLEYQTCLAVKFCQMLIAMYKSNPTEIDEILSQYPLRDIMYDLYVHYIINDSQTSNKANNSNNIYSNEVYLFIKNVVLQSINDQDAIDELVIKIVTNFILDSNPVYSQARVIESIEHLPYSYNKVLKFAYEKLIEDQEVNNETRSVQQIFKAFNDTGAKMPQDIRNDSKIRLLMTTLVLNNLKTTAPNLCEFSDLLDTLIKIIDWIIQNDLLDLENKKFLLRMCLDLMDYLVIQSKPQDSISIIEQKEFLTQLTLTIFLINSNAHNQYLSKIFDYLYRPSDTFNEELIKTLNKEELINLEAEWKNGFEVLTGSFTFWENIINLFLKDEYIKQNYLKNAKWIENLIFSLTKLLAVTESLKDHIKLVQDHNKYLSIDLTGYKISEFSPKLDIIMSIVDLLKYACQPQSSSENFSSYTKSQIMSLWSLVFDILSRTDIQEVFNNKILSEMITTLFESQIEFQEISYLTQTDSKIKPNAKFASALVFEILNKSIGTKYEDAAWSLCNKWLEVLIYKPYGDDTTWENMQVIVNFDLSSDIATILEDTSKFLIKYLNLWYFNGIAGVPIVGKAEIFSQLLLLTKITTATGELLLEKAFIESQNDPELNKKLTKGLNNIIAWLLLNSGECSGPIQKHLKAIEVQCKYIIMVASEVKSASRIEDVMRIYNLLMTNITELVQQGRISTAIAFIKARSIHKILESIFEYLIVSDEIAEAFVFQQKGLSHFMQMMLNENPRSTINDSADEEEEKIETSNIEVSLAKPLEDESLDEGDNELLDFIKKRLNEPTLEASSPEIKNEEVFAQKNLSRNVATGDFVPNEFARTMTLVDSNISKAKEIVSNMDWSVNKKGYRQRLISQKFEPEHNNEIWLLFKLNRFIEIKEIQIGFTNFWTIETEVYIEPSSVIVEAGMTEQDLNSHSNSAVWSLEKIEDKGFANFGVTVYGLNLYSFNQQSKSDNLDELINSNFNSLQSIKARYLKIRIKNNFVSCLENSPLWNKYMKPRAIGINYCSIMGYDISNVGSIENTIVDLKRETSSKVLGLLFKGNFPKTLSKVSLSLEYTDFLKQSLPSIMQLLSDQQMSHVIGLILQTFVSYNKSLGDWIISKCLDLDCDSKQVNLLYTLINCNPKEYFDRLNIIKNFIFEKCRDLASSDNLKPSEVIKLVPFFDTYLDLVTLYSKNLQIQIWYQEVFQNDEEVNMETVSEQTKLWLSITSSELVDLMTILLKQDQEENHLNTYLKFCLTFIINGIIKVDDTDKVSYYNSNDMVMEPVHVVDNFLCSDLENALKSKMLSMIAASLNRERCRQILGLIMNRLDIDEISKSLQEAQSQEKFDDHKFESKLEFWNNWLNNEDLRVMIDPKMGLKLYLDITALSISHPTKLSLNQKRLVISLIIKLTIGFKDKETVLANKIIEDLEYLQDKKDTEFVNNILTPLLKAENKLPVSLDFIDNKNQTYLSFNKFNEQTNEVAKYYNFLSRPELSDISKHFSNWVSKHYNDQKLLISKWKLLHSIVGKPNTAVYDDMLKKMQNRSCFFILIEGVSKSHSDRESRKHPQKSVIGIYNRNAIYMEKDEYHIKTSNDNFCFAVHNKSDYACFTYGTNTPLIEFDDKSDPKSLKLASKFMTLKFPDSKQMQVGNINEDLSKIIFKTTGYEALQDFKEEKIEIWVLDSMLELTENSQQKSLGLSTEEYKLSDKFEQSQALSMFRQNCYLLPKNLTLIDVVSECFGFQVFCKTMYEGKTLEEIYSAQKLNKLSDNIIDVTINLNEFIDKATQLKESGHSKPSRDSKRYLPEMGIFDRFEKEGGVSKLISITQKSVRETWKNKELAEKWGLWLEELESFTKLPSFFQLFIKDKHFKDLLFEILAGVPDYETSNSQHWAEKQAEAVKLTYKIIKEMFQLSRDSDLRQKATENGLIEKILLRLQEVTGEHSRKLNEGLEIEEKKEEKPVEEQPKEDNQDKPIKNYEKKKRKGVGYTTGVGKTWNVNQYIKNKKVKNEQITYLIDILANFFRTKDWIPSQEIIDSMLESCLLPLVENAFRTSSLLEMAKYHKLYISYLRLVRVFAKENSKKLAELLIDIDTKYKPAQLEAIYKLLSKMNDLANIYNSWLQSQSNNESEKESEILIKEIKKTHKSVTRTVEKLSKFAQDEHFYENALALPLENGYPLLLQNLRFDNMDMRNEAGNYVHHYIKNYSSNLSSAKINRLAQELADLSTALPTDHTNAIFVRVDKERVDLMKALVMGAVGTPYAHGAFEFDIYWNQNYPKDPPKMNLTTTGSSAVRFNPNLYACGKVCLSLLGTWRGNATENWDPKISTILQVLMSTQAIIMSEEIYFNEPGFEGEAGTPDGERKNEGYSNIIKYCNIKFAMLEQVKKPSKGFETVIRRHFYLKRDEIMKDCKKWIQEASENEALYTGLVSDHNYNWCNKFKTKGAFEKMLKEVVDELEIELYKLPEPSGHDLLPSKNHRKKRAHLKARDINEGAEKLDNIDVDSDEEMIVTTTQEINIEKEDVKDRWSRYIGAMGIEAVAKQASSNVFLSGASAAGIEISKNVVLAGCKTFTLHDTKIASLEDLSGQFFLQLPDIGKNRAEASIKRLQQLNYYVKCNASSIPIPDTEEELKKQAFDKYNVICLSQCSHKSIIAVNNFCRKHGIKFILFDVYGPFSRVFNDFGHEFIVLDKDGEDLKERWIKSITNEKEGLLEVLDAERHDLDDGDKVAITEVIGMEIKPNEKSNFNSVSINETIHDVKVISPFVFKIGDTTKFENYERNGKITQVKVPVTNKFNSFEDWLKSKDVPYDQNLSIADFEKMPHIPISHACFLALDAFIEEKERIPKAWNKDDADAFMKLTEEIAKETEQEFDTKWQNLSRLFSFTCSGVFNPLCAFIGGIVAQEIVKAMTQKYTPINQFLYFDSSEVWPEFDVNSSEIYGQVNFDDLTKSLDIELAEHRSDGLRIVIGGNLLKKLEYSQVFMVGAGAIGWELLKNYAMLGVGTGKETKEKKGGRIILTDPDHIETSNLNRQFLFREKHIQKSKSSTAAAAAIAMNKDLKGNVLARLDKVHEGTENIFTDSFFQNLTMVTNALDNIAARRYIDGRCVTARTPLLESGTLGPKGHVQVVLPFKTESYSSQVDPEDNNQIPHCTLKMFPEEAIHCIEWGKDIFTSLFMQNPQEVNKILEDQSFYPQTSQEITSLKQVLKCLNTAPKTFEDCIRLAREKFNEYFNYNIKQLLYVYPLDTKTKDDKPFWTLPKRPPHDIEFDPEVDAHINFISACACLYAIINRIKIPFEHSREVKAKQEIAKIATKFEVVEFKPDDNQAKEIKSMVEKEENKDQDQVEEEEKADDTDVDALMKELKTILDEIKPFIKKGETYMQVEEFEKDNDSNYHVDFISAISNLRCINYKLKEMSWLDVKLKAGKIIPALATTTAAIAGMQTLELVKVLKCEKIEEFRNYYLNLALPLIQASEPGAVQKTKLHSDLEVDLWTRWDIYKKDITLQEMFDHIRDTYKLWVKDVMKGNQTIYLHSIMDIVGKEKEKLDTLDSKIIDLWDVEDEEYVDLSIACTKLPSAEESQVEDHIIEGVPPVRIYFKE